MFKLGGDMERKLAKKFNKSNDFYFACSNPNCSGTFQTAALPRKQQSAQERMATFEAEAEESFKSHVCSTYQQPK